MPNANVAQADGVGVERKESIYPFEIVVLFEIPTINTIDIVD